MAGSKQSPSTRRLSEVARYVVKPIGIEKGDGAGSLWPAVERKAVQFGDEFDQWQRDLGALILAIRADGLYAATIGGITLSIPRQVAKTFLVGRIVFVLCVLFPGLRVIWTAHHERTATNTFNRLAGYADRRKVAPHVATIRRANGQQQIEFTNGSIIEFGARERGFGRGFDEVDVEVFDEAQILTEKALENMIAATNQTRHPHGALLFYMGTPPRPSDPGEAFTIRRDEALAGETEDAVYVECSADRDAKPDDHKQWAKGNPSFPARTPLQSMLRLRKNLPGEDSWRREALGIWDEIATRAKALIESDSWDRIEVDRAPEDGAVAYGVKFSPDGMTVALAAAVRPDAGPVHVEGIEHRSVIDGTRWLVEWLRSRDARAIIDGRSGSGALISALRKASVPARRVHQPTVEEVITAHAAFVNAVGLGDVSHLADDALSASIASAGRRKIGNLGGWGFQSIDDGDVTLAEAVVLAHLGASQAPRQKASGRKVVVLS